MGNGAHPPDTDRLNRSIVRPYVKEGYANVNLPKAATIGLMLVCAR